MCAPSFSTSTLFFYNLLQNRPQNLRPRRIRILFLQMRQRHPVQSSRCHFSGKVFQIPVPRRCLAGQRPSKFGDVCPCGWLIQPVSLTPLDNDGQKHIVSAHQARRAPKDRDLLRRIDRNRLADVTHQIDYLRDIRVNHHRSESVRCEGQRHNKQVSFESIENDILYAVDKGSVVKDYMGYVKEDYNFDFDHLDQLTVGGKALSMYQEGNTWYFGDGEPGPQNYRFKVVYDAGNKAETEMFTWYINEPVSNFAPVQLTYTVKLINPKTADGTYGKYDRDGSQHYEGLYTNQEAVLYPVDSRGNEYRSEEFPKPTVSYVVEHGSQEPGSDPTPTPNPGNNGGGSHGGHGGGSSSGSKKSSTTTASGPAAQPTEPVTPVVPEPQPVVPAEGLPKTGDTDRMDVPMALLAIGMMAAAYVIMTGRKKTEE